MFRVSTQITGKLASASILKSHCDSGPEPSKRCVNRLKQFAYIGLGDTRQASRLNMITENHGTGVWMESSLFIHYFKAVFSQQVVVGRVIVNNYGGNL